MICRKNNRVSFLITTLISFSFLTACSADESLNTQAYLESNRPDWVPSNSVLMFGTDGSVWAYCAWKKDLYHCSFYETDVDVRVEQSYQLCSPQNSGVLIARSAQSWLRRYDSDNIYFLPVTPPKYFGPDVMREGRFQKPVNEFNELEIDDCLQKFVPATKTE